MRKIYDFIGSIPMWSMIVVCCIVIVIFGYLFYLELKEKVKKSKLMTRLLEDVNQIENYNQWFICKEFYQKTKIGYNWQVVDGLLNKADMLLQLSKPQHELDLDLINEHGFPDFESQEPVVDHYPFNTDKIDLSDLKLNVTPFTKDSFDRIVENVNIIANNRRHEKEMEEFEFSITHRPMLHEVETIFFSSLIEQFKIFKELRPKTPQDVDDIYLDYFKGTGVIKDLHITLYEVFKTDPHNFERKGLLANDILLFRNLVIDKTDLWKQELTKNKNHETKD